MSISRSAAGIGTSRTLARDFVSRFEALAEKLEAAYSRETKVLALTIPERGEILAGLDDPPPGLEEVRGVLIREREWRVREGLEPR